jgi:hypothetical protein
MWDVIIADNVNDFLLDIAAVAVVMIVALTLAARENRRRGGLIPEPGPLPPVPEPPNPTPGPPGPEPRPAPPEPPLPGRHT